MDAFYKNLSEGNSKSLALQQAQVSFLNENSQNALVHPYYWSGFIISGNTSAIATTNNWLWYVAIGVVLLLIIGLLVKKNQKSS
jgi:LPXTG-motif cell wall-anchored protein